MSLFSNPGYIGSNYNTQEAETGYISLVILLEFIISQANSNTPKKQQLHLKDLH